MKATIKISVFMACAMLLLNSCSKKEDETLKKYKVEFSPVKPSKDHLLNKVCYVTAEVDGKEIKSGDEVEEGKEVVFTSHVGTASRSILDKWEVTGAEAPTDAPKTFTIKAKGPLKVMGIFKLFTPVL